jgi:hypothetical protein
MGLRGSNITEGIPRVIAPWSIHNEHVDITQYRQIEFVLNDSISWMEHKNNVIANRYFA